MKALQIRGVEPSVPTYPQELRTVGAIEPHNENSYDCASTGREQTKVRALGAPRTASMTIADCLIHVFTIKGTRSAANIAFPGKIGTKLAASNHTYSEGAAGAEPTLSVSRFTETR